MARNKRKGIVRNITLGMITVLLTGAVISSQSKVAQAKEVFLGVQKIRDEIINTPTETFTILEIVDETGVYSVADDGTNGITYNFKAGEEELGFLIGGSEPFREGYARLYELSRYYSQLDAVADDGSVQIPAIDTGRMNALKTAYDALIATVPTAFLGEDKSEALLGGQTVTSFQPNPGSYQECLRFVSDSPVDAEGNPMTEGVLVQDPNGVYMWVGDETTGQYMYVGEISATSIILNTGMQEDEESGEEEEETEDEETGEEEEETEDEETGEEDEEPEDGETPPTGDGTTPPTGDGTTPPTGDGTTPPTGDGTTPPTGDGTMPPTGDGTTPPTGDGTTPPTGDGTTPPTGDGTMPPTGDGTTPPTGDGTTPPSGDGTTPPSGDGTTPPSGDGTTPPSGDGTTPPSESGTDTTPQPTGGDIPPQTSLPWGKEIGYGKQKVLLSGNLSQPTDRYSFYATEGDIPEELKNNTKIAVSTGGNTAVGSSPSKIQSIYQFSFMGMENYEWFRNHVFGMELQEVAGSNPPQALKIEVITCTPDDSALAAKIEIADLVYLNADSLKVDQTEISADITTENAIALLEKITGADTLPCIINDAMYQQLQSSNPVKDTDLNKLICILYQNGVKSVFENPQYGFHMAANWTDADDATNDMTSMTVWGILLDTLTDTTDPAYLNGGHFVRDNIYVINHAINSVTTGSRLYDEVMGSTEEENESIRIGFEEVEYRVEQEAYEREQLAVNEWPTDMKRTPALAIQTILTYTAVPAVIEKSNIVVLELQPCYSFTYAGSSEKAQKFKEKFLPANSSAQVEIVGMTTSEFCGKIDDINVKYDMIYIGSNTDLMNRVAVGNSFCTLYNDFEMYGIVYSHIGDLCHLGSHSGLLTNNECNTYRYSGNDILASQEKELLEFLNSGAPIVVADDFFVTDATGGIIRINSGDTGEKITDPNKNVADISRQGILDSSSYIYQFVKQACANKDVTYGNINWTWNNRKYHNFLTESDVDTADERDAFSKWLNQPKMVIHMLSQPTEYNYTTRTENGYNVIADSSYLLPVNGEYYLTYEFSISNLTSVDVAGRRYEALLWIDTNMDGKFSDNTENLSGDHFVVQVADTGEVVARDNLRSGIRYRVSRQLPYDIVGAIPWKLTIRDRDNINIRSAVTGLSAIRMYEKQNIRILQLYDTKNQAANIQENMQIAGNPWQVLLSNVPDFEVSIKSIDATAYFNGTIQEELDNYDMLILGFADVYQSHNSFKRERLDEIIAYANSGKCVLFSHDNTNWTNGNNNTLNMYIRDLTGLDRYGVTVYRTGDSNLYSTNNKIKNGTSIPQNGMMDSTEALATAIFDSMGMAEYKRDIAFAINKEQRQMDSRTQGITYSGNEHDRYATTSNSSYIQYKGKNYGDYYRYLNFANAPKGTWQDVANGDYEIEKINQGAITEYPYRLSDKIKVASTHGQYYQLDLESDKDRDGEGDIVVWYTLNNSVAGQLNDVYDYSPRDVRNNYYIYNRGNITYTGMGHKNIQNEEEIKLFINTMVAAYRVSVIPPTLQIIEGNGDDTNKDFDAIPVDTQIGNQTSFYNVYFKVKDINLVSDNAKKIQAKIYLGEGSQPLIVDGETFQVTDKTNAVADGWKVYETATNNELAVQYDDITGKYCYLLTSGKEYYVQVPLVGVSSGEVHLSESKSLDVWIEVQSRVEKYGKMNVSSYIYDTFKLNQINLFELD